MFYKLLYLHCSSKKPSGEKTSHFTRVCRCVLDPLKDWCWTFLQKKLMDDRRLLFSQKTPGYIWKDPWESGIRALREKCPNTKFFLVRIQPKYEKLRTRKSSVFGHFSRSGDSCDSFTVNLYTVKWQFSRQIPLS